MTELEREINEAYQFLREHNHTVSSETIEYMRTVALLGAKQGAIHKVRVKLRRRGIGGVLFYAGMDLSKELDGRCATVLLVPYA